jgi:hypothetical protein
MVHVSLVPLVGWLSVCVLFLSACATPIRHQASAIAVGATPAQVREVLGAPQDRLFQGNREAWQ